MGRRSSDDGHLAAQMGEAAEKAADAAAPAQAEKLAQGWPGMSLFGDPAKVMEAQAQMWAEGLDIWQRALGQAAGGAEEKSALAEKADKDRRFAAPEWRDNPLFDTIRQTYLLVSERMLGSVDAIEGVDAKTREKIASPPRLRRAMSPSNFRADQPQCSKSHGDQGRKPAPRARTYAQRTWRRAAGPVAGARSRSGATSRPRRASGQAE